MERRPDEPLSSVPVIHDRLQACMAQPDQVEISLDAEQVTIRNFTQRRLDFFYTDHFDGYDLAQRSTGAEFRVAAQFRHFFFIFLANFSAALVHSSAVIRQDKAALFLARSTGGKSTVAGLANGSPVLNDDQTIMRKEGQIVSVHATPLGRITDGPAQAPLGGMFLLEKASHFELVPMSPTEMIDYVWEAAPYPANLPRHLKTQMFDVIAGACLQSATYRMRFSKNYVDWDAIDRVMGVG
ncbi:MAG: hypothetical protein JXQ72_14160 [Anaerolineae bacterium]|nr:hypothetical protein [Anaerolineae bacterium]